MTDTDLVTVIVQIDGFVGGLHYPRSPESSEDQYMAPRAKYHYCGTSLERDAIYKDIIFKAVMSGSYQE
jgi:hypothetical protein